jgi:hypothetical protein
MINTYFGAGALFVIGALITPLAHAQESLSDFGQPDGFAQPSQRKMGAFAVGFQHISQVDLSNNINLQPAGGNGYRYTGSLLANFSGKLGSSDMKGSAGVQLIDQEEPNTDATSRSTNFIGDLKLRSPLTEHMTNFLSFKSEEEVSNDSQVLVKTTSLSTTRTNTLSDRLEIGLSPAWQIAVDGSVQAEHYNTTNEKDVGKQTLSQESLFKRDNSFVTLTLTHNLTKPHQVYAITQFTQSTGGSFSSASLDQDSISVGAGIKSLAGDLKYQLELAYGSSDATSVAANGSSTSSTETAVFGQATAQYALSKRTRIYGGVARSVSVDITTSNNAALETVPVLHLQTDITNNWYAGVRLEYPMIEVLGTDMEIDNPNASLKSGFRFSPTLNIEGTLKYQEQTVNAAAQSAGIEEFDESVVTLILNWYF